MTAKLIEWLGSARRSFSRRRGRLPRALGAIGIALGVVLAAPPAGAQAMEVVSLKDGSKYQGPLVEKVMGQRVVIELATGEIKAFSWDSIADSSAAPPAGMPALAGGPSSDVVLGLPVDSDHVVTGWPDPHAPPPPDTTPRARAGQTLDVGLVTSLPQFGSPRGIAGVVTEYDPARWLGLEVAGAYDGPVEVAEGDLGWSLSETLRLGSGFGLGVGASQHIGGIGRGVAQMGHAEMYFDLDTEGMSPSPITVRMAFGAATMFNGGEHPGACGFFNLAGSGAMDENGHPNATSCAFVYFDVEILYRIPLTRDRSAP